MNDYRAYVLTLGSISGVGSLHLDRFEQVRLLLDSWRSQWCAPAPGECDHTGGLNITFERVFFTDGFVSAPPSDYVGGINLLSNRCPSVILEALNG